MSDDFQNEIGFLGIESFASFVRQPEGNGCIKRFFRTLKEHLLWIRRFRNLHEVLAYSPHLGIAITSTGFSNDGSVEP